MNDEFEAFLDAMDAQANRDIEAAATRPAKPQQKFPCQACQGTGRYQGPRVHQTKSECFACRGTGFFKTDPAVRQARKDAKVKKEAQAVSDFILANRALVEGLAKVASWNSFAATMLGELGLMAKDVARRIQSIEAGFNFRGGKVLTPNQVAACERMLAKIAIRQEAKEERKVKEAVEVDLTPIRTMFETAVANGYKKPTYRADGLVISRAPDTGSNPGALYVKDEAGEYMGKILGTTFHPVRNAAPAGEALLVIAQDPLQAALRYGQRTGNCACCGRLLTNHTSIDAGIGPICKTKWGL